MNFDIIITRRVAVIVQGRDGETYRELVPGQPVRVRYAGRNRFRMPGGYAVLPADAWVWAYQYAAEQFVRAWQAAETPFHAAEAVGLDVDSAVGRADAYRQLGVNLKRFPGGY